MFKIPTPNALVFVSEFRYGCDSTVVLRKNSVQLKSLGWRTPRLLLA